MVGVWRDVNSRPAKARLQEAISKRFPVAIKAGPATAAFVVVVPDLPGCFSAGDTLDEALAGAEEAAAAWIDAALDAGEAIPAPASPESLRANQAYEGWIFAVSPWNPPCLTTRSSV
jgi:predicted RNase H-like HicB family nuclease